MWLGKFRYSLPVDIKSMGYLYSLISLIIGVYFLNTGFILYSCLIRYSLIVGYEFYKMGFGLGLIGSVWILFSIYGILALKYEIDRYIKLYSFLAIALGFCTCTICLTGYFMARIPDIGTDAREVSLYNKMYSYFMNNLHSQEMNSMEREFNCCGINQFEDYIIRDSLQKQHFLHDICIPKNSCGFDNCKNLSNGCFQKFSWYINRKIYSVAIAGVVIYILSTLGSYAVYTYSLFKNQNLL